LPTVRTELADRVIADIDDVDRVIRAYLHSVDKRGERALPPGFDKGAAWLINNDAFLSADEQVNAAV
jgi:hypothetical protein